MNAHKLHREQSIAQNDLLGVVLEAIAPAVAVVLVPAVLVLLAGFHLLR